MELVLESLASGGAALLDVRLHPDSWEVRYRRAGPREERYEHVERLSLATGDATARELTPIILLRWSLVYEEHPERFDLWEWSLPPGVAPNHDGRFLG